MVAHACIPSYSGGWGRRIAWTQEAEVEVSQDRTIASQAQWLTPVIQALWRPRRADHLRSEVQDQPDQHGETPSLKKKKKKRKENLTAKNIF